ncbi:MAG TPA: hypothetical protein VH189_15200, partial [Rhizomicrobium sp.]|nr:hypothetical protein [Rhizomicrobium sp.]
MRILLRVRPFRAFLIDQEIGARSGAPNAGGSIVTGGGVLFAGATTDRTFRAFDSRTGKELWSAEFPNNS